MANVLFNAGQEYIFSATFDEDHGLMFFPTGESVVRCKDCKYYVQGKSMTGHDLAEGRCEYHGLYVGADGFCSRGEK